MSLTGLRAFHLVAQAGGFTKAARAGHVSQPTVSAQVRALEEAHGVRLFDRRGRTVALTPLGQNLLAITTRLFAAEEEADALLAGARTLATGHLRVAADSASHVMPLLAELKRRHGGLTFSLRIGNSNDVVTEVLEYVADVGITAKQTSDPRIHSIRLRADRLVVFVPAAHRWAAPSS
jgi:DNA-binding transcriptional LysR family regulator